MQILRPTTGDTVTIVSGDHKGREGVIIRDDEDEQPYEIQFDDDGTKFWFREHEVEPSEPHTTSPQTEAKPIVVSSTLISNELSVGTRVMALNDDYYGCMGLITKHDNAEKIFELQLDDGIKIWVPEDLVSRKDSEETPDVAVENSNFGTCKEYEAPQDNTEPAQTMDESSDENWGDM